MTAKPNPDTPLLAAEKTIRRLDADLQAARKRLKSIHEANDTAETIRQAIYGLSEHRPEPPEWTLRPGLAGHRGCPMLMVSDIHYSEVVNKIETGGANEFNSKIAAKRMERLYNTTADLAFNHMGRAKTIYPGIVVAFGGDMIGGDIHEELAKTNDRTPQQSVNDLTDLLGGLVDNLAAKFGRIFIPCVVGNHGRATKKMQMKQRVFTSIEWNIYCNLERHYRTTKNVSFQVSNEADAFFNVFGHRYMLTHGDSLGVKGGDGIIGAIGPIMRGTMKMHRSEAQIGRDFDTLLLGHWHQYLTLPGLIVNNAFKGYDEYARLGLRAPYSRASQALWFTHPEHGITAHWQVYLQDLMTANKSQDWVTWPK